MQRGISLKEYQLLVKEKDMLKTTAKNLDEKLNFSNQKCHELEKKLSGTQILYNTLRNRFNTLSN